jgi:hypothetical protein
VRRLWTSNGSGAKVIFTRLQVDDYSVLLFFSAHDEHFRVRQLRPSKSPKKLSVFIVLAMVCMHYRDVDGSLLTLYCSGQLTLNDFAILIRVNAMSRAIEQVWIGIKLLYL